MANAARRIFIAIFGICAITWATAAILDYRADAAFSDTAERVVSGEKFRVAQLNVMKRQFDAASARPLRASASSSGVFISLLLLEETLKAGNRQSSSASDFDELEMLVKKALAQSPTSSFMWLTGFWLKRLRSGYAEADLNLLRMSYRSGPNEGWIAIRRNPLALGVFRSLPNEIAEQALSEFVGLVRSDLFADAANIFAGPGWVIRDQLLGRLVQVEEVYRRGFAKALASKDLSVTIPGVEERPSRPF
jgi:hypothetical protein